jgi:hypothetical protein
LSDSSKNDPKKSGDPSAEDSEKIDASSEEDLFFKPDEGETSQDAPPDALEEGERESIDSFESLDDLQLETLSEAPPAQFEQEDQQIPAFNSIGDSIDESVGELRAPPLADSGEASSIRFSQPDTKTIDSIKNYSESLNAGAPASAQLPFTLRIEGKLTAQESEKLLDILSREKMDIREVDLEPQLEAGRILLPRISEYAGILLIQALRGIRAKIYFQPSDIDASNGNYDFNSDSSALFLNPNDEPQPLAAESLPVSQGEDLPQLGVFQVIDTLVVSGMLSTKAVEALNSNEFTTLTEALMKELKFKAARRGARGITHLSIQLIPLTLPTDYRVTVSGTAVS